MNSGLINASAVVGMVVLGCLLFCVTIYAVTLSRSKKGLMVTFRGWTDLWVSSLWPLFVPLGALFFGFDVCDQTSTITWWRVLGAFFLAAGLVSFLWLIFFALKNNWFHPWNIFLALNTRFMASVIVFLAFAKVWSLFHSPKRDEQRTMHGTVGSVLVTSAVFVWFVRPLVSVGLD